MLGLGATKGRFAAGFAEQYAPAREGPTQAGAHYFIRVYWAREFSEAAHARGQMLTNVHIARRCGAYRAGADASTRETWTGAQRVPPRGVRTPLASSASAICARDAAPAFRAART